MAAIRQGSRWLHQMPTEKEVKEWFEQQPLHPGMSPGPYMGGIVLIGAEEKVKRTKQKQNGETYVSEESQSVFVPYVKVDTRIAYFRDYVRTLNGGSERGDYIGVIEPVPQARMTDPSKAVFNAHLPEGFSVMPIRAKSGDSVASYLVCTSRVAIYERQSYGRRVAGEQVRPLLEGIGSKQSALIPRNYIDDNVLMKAETGSVGRALGMAGILVVGTGVATAEDIQESMSLTPGASTGPEAAALPDEGVPEAQQPVADATEAPEAAQEQDDAALRQRATALRAEMQEGFPQAWEAYVAWWTERGFAPLAELTGPALKGVLVKLERDLDAAKRA